jgi:glycerol-3-phosphate dehydrogenase (NAD(P)+)
MDLKVAVIGAGSWGTTVAHLTAENTPTTLWARRKEVADEINVDHENATYLPGYSLCPDLQASDSLHEVVAGADVIVMGVPSHCFRSTLSEVAGSIRPWVPVVSLVKGLEQDTRFRMTEVIQSVIPGHPYGVLTGPNLAKEILAGGAAASVLAMSDDNIATQLQAVFAGEAFRVYLNSDVVGCEVGGAAPPGSTTSLTTSSPRS